MNDQEAAITRTLRFLKRICRQTRGLIEIRCLPSGSQLFTRDFQEIKAFILNHIRQNVYFGVATRKDKDGSKAGVFDSSALGV